MLLKINKVEDNIDEDNLRLSPLLLDNYLAINVSQIGTVRPKSSNIPSRRDIRSLLYSTTYRKSPYQKSQEKQILQKNHHFLSTMKEQIKNSPMRRTQQFMLCGLTTTNQQQYCTLDKDQMVDYGFAKKKEIIKISNWYSCSKYYQRDQNNFKMALSYKPMARFNQDLIIQGRQFQKKTARQLDFYLEQQNKQQEKRMKTRIPSPLKSFQSQKEKKLRSPLKLNELLFDEIQPWDIITPT